MIFWCAFRMRVRLMGDFRLKALVDYRPVLLAFSALPCVENGFVRSSDLVESLRL